jgi:hypothetical protein
LRARANTIPNQLVTLTGETTSKLVAADDLAAVITNMKRNEEGGLESSASAITYTNEFGLFGTIRGIFHARLKGGTRDVLLVHHGTALDEFAGWKFTKIRKLIDASGAQLDGQLPTENISGFPTQFATTTTGIVIIPQGGRAYFYDGDIIAPLGFSEVPAPPEGLGPASSDAEYTPSVANCGINDMGYSFDALYGRPSAMSRVWRFPRVGTIQTLGDTAGVTGESDQVLKGFLASGRWRGKTQLVDHWGNLSAVSNPSNEIQVDRQPATGFVAASGGSGAGSPFISPDAARKQFAWNNIARGPAHTAGRIMFRTPDMNTGRITYHEMPGNAMATIGSFATIPDNITTTLPDNVPDGWLGAEPIECDPVPMAKLCCMAMGRLWLANSEDEPGMIRPSVPGLWGTYLKGDKYFPDPQGAEVTAIYPVDRGMIACTETSTYLVEPNADGNGFRSSNLSASVGCVSPSTIRTLGNGVVVWLSRDGFYAYDGQSVSYAFTGHELDAKEFVLGRLREANAYYDSRTGRYRCWLAAAGASTPSTCWEYDGVTWYKNIDVISRSCCATQDHRKLGLVGGIKIDGVNEDIFVMDHNMVDVREGSVETVWIGAMSSSKKRSVRNVQLWLRETGKEPSITVEVFADWRSEVVSTHTIARYPEVYGTAATGNPSFYDNDEVIGTAVWRKRRPFWARLDIDVPACEAFKLKISFAEDERSEILGYQFDWTDRDDGAARSF